MGGRGARRAALGLWLLLNQATTTYVLTKTVISIGFTVGAVGVSVLWFRRSMTRHGLLAITA